MKMIGSQILFFMAISASVFYGAQGFRTFRHQQPQDLLYLSFLDDDILEQEEPIGYKVPLEELEVISDNEEKSTRPPEKELLIKNKVKFLNDENDLTEAELTSRLKEVVTTSNTNIWDTKAKTNEKMFFQTDLYDTDIDVQSAPKLPTPEPNYVSDRFTKVYLKAITNLIQHIMDALFSANLTDDPKPETKLNDIFESKPIRQIKKRDISKRDAENSVSSKDQSTNHTKEITQAIEKGTSNSKKPIIIITNKDNTALNLPTDEIVSATSSESSKLKQVSGQMSNNEIDISASSSHSTMMSTHPTTLANNEDDASKIHTKIVLNDKKELNRLSPPKDVISIDDLINDEGTILNSLKITSKELHDINPDTEYNNPKLVQHPLTGDNDNNAEESTSGVVMVVTGTILVVLILVSIGAGVAYAVQKRYLQTANQNSSNQRTAMA